MTADTPARRAVRVELGERAYDILIGPGLIASAGREIASRLKGRRIAVVTDAHIAPLYLDAFMAALAAEGIEAVSLVLPAGEKTKSFEHLMTVCDKVLAARIERNDAVVALGGGVIGDLTGFAAGIVRRGSRFIQVPTSLLAQVDSSVGGKTGINHPGGKNLVGAFHQPLCVVSDSDTLRSLPDRELSAGLAEVLKGALIADAPFFEWLEAHASDLLGREAAALNHAIRRSCEIKAEVVAGDERERGRRALLNLGHTFGHAIELCAGYGTWLHGEAVGAGIGMAARFSQRLGWLRAADVARINTALQALRLPTKPPAADPQAFLAAMAMDKKVLAGRMRLILLPAIGQGRVSADFNPQELQDFVRGELAA